MTKHFGLSNIYLKMGSALVVISLAMFVTALLFPSTIKNMNISASTTVYFFISGSVLYIIGRIAQIWRARTGLTKRSSRTASLRKPHGR